MMQNIFLVIVSFLASLGFSLVQHMVGRDVLLAGLGGALTRIVYLILLNFIDDRIVYSLLAALFAALYAEFLAAVQRMPATIYLYPSIVPLIPGDLLYNTMVGILVQDLDRAVTNGIDCTLTLVGMCVGFVLSSTVAHYIRRHNGALRFIRRIFSRIAQRVGIKKAR